LDVISHEQKMTNTTIGLLIGIFAIWYGLNSYQNPPSGTGSVKRTYLFKDYFTMFLLIILAILLATNTISISEIIK